MTSQLAKKAEAWSARFNEPVSDLVKRYTASVFFDKRLALFDIQGSLAHAAMLAKQGIIAEADRAAIEKGMAQIRQEIEAGTFEWKLDLEDVHLNIEARLTAMAGDAGKRLHTGRSRNDQVATDIRLWLRSEIDNIVGLLKALRGALLDLAEQHTNTIVPGFTHLQVAQVIQHSSNIGTTKIAMTLKPQEMWDMFTSVGLGQAPKIGFPGAVAGRLRPANKWRRIEQATMSYGYGLSVSLFQIAHAYTIFAHDGELIPITMYRTNGQPPQGERVISPEVARQVRQMLETVTAPGGTAPQAQVMGYRVGGKTGTAWKHTGRGYDRSKYRASFIGLAPMSNPRIIVAVSVDEPTVGNRYGGGAAGPVFSQIVGGTLRALNVPPDSPVRQLVMSPEVPEEPVGGLQ